MRLQLMEVLLRAVSSLADLASLLPNRASLTLSLKRGSGARSTALNRRAITNLLATLAALLMRALLLMAGLRINIVLRLLLLLPLQVIVNST